MANKLDLIENLARTALAKRKQMTVLTTDNADSARVSSYLWQNSPTGFLPNLQIDATNLDLATSIKATFTPVIIGCDIKTLFQDDVLINLTINEPIFFSRFTQLIEMIGLDDDDKSTGRRRYKFYRDRGYEIKTIDHAMFLQNES